MDRISLMFAAAIDRWQSHITEAAQRFDIPASWIRAHLEKLAQTSPDASKPPAIPSGVLFVPIFTTSERWQ